MGRVTAEATTVLDADWLQTCRQAVHGLRGVLAEHPTSRERVVETGTRGEGGDRTLVIDSAVEDVVFAELERLHDQGLRFCAVSEERGVVDFGSEAVRVVIDPIDGSLNAKRGLPHHALSIAVADGPTMADVTFGFVHDFGARDEWHAVRGGGAFLGGRRLPTDVPERRMRDGKLEVLGIESADPRWVRDAADDLAGAAHRVRALGALAITVCQVAAARLDAMASIRNCRAVDVAAAQLVVREAGGVVAFTTFDDPLAAPLDLQPHSPIVAARTAEGLAALRHIPL
jgi:myo-inositol-1(or 4)-monophosphatase